MIGIGLVDLIVLVMFLGTLHVCLLWFYSFWRERRRELHRRRIAVQCRICGCTYATGKGSTRITTCPSCGSRNERGHLQPL